MERRRFLKLLGVSFAVGAVNAVPLKMTNNKPHPTMSVATVIVDHIIYYKDKQYYVPDISKLSTDFDGDMVGLTVMSNGDYIVHRYPLLEASSMTYVTKEQNNVFMRFIGERNATA